MPQFSFLRVRSTTLNKPHQERYLDFRKHPHIDLAVDMAAASLFNRTEDATRHAQVYYDKLVKSPQLINAYLGKESEVTVVIDVIHYTGEYVTSLVATTETLHKIRFVPKHI
ncbi:hypothetical protein D3C79_49710 [compost metagenome]